MTKNRQLRNPTDMDGEILIAVIHSLQEPWLTITKEGQFKTWLSRVDTKKIRVVHFYANPPGKLTNKLDKINEDLRWRRGGVVSRIRNRVFHILLSPWKLWIPGFRKGLIEGVTPKPNAIRIKLIDMYATTRWKRLAIMKYFLAETQCEYLLMTTSSSYLRPEELLLKLHKISDKNLYAGSLIPLYENAFFCSGAQTVLNRSAVNTILKQRSKIPVELLDDLGLGVVCEKIGIHPHELGTINIGSMDMLNSLSMDSIREHHHFRLKSETNGLRNDVAIFHKLDQIVLRIEDDQD